MTETLHAELIDADVVVVGAGPGGLAAAQAAAAAGASVLGLDSAPAAGGQIWRARQGVAAAPVARSLVALAQAGVRLLPGARVVMPLPYNLLLIDGPQGAQRVRWRRLILATGARERLLPFPGWTLPGVFGAGGMQALVKGGWPIAGKRVVVAGTGPLLLAAAATLKREGAQVMAIVEEAPIGALAGFAGTLLRHPAKAVAALGLARALWGVPFLKGRRIVSAEGKDKLTRVVLSTHDGGAEGRDEIDCDALAAGWGLLPQTELAEALGCTLAPRFDERAVVVDERQRTSVDDVYAVGECTGVAGVRSAGLQGRIAGQAAAGGGAPAARLVRAAAREGAFAAAVARTFPVPGRWSERLRDDTIVCRCEDVSWAAVRRCPDLRSAKLATRCGMGHCQGRLCHAGLSASMQWQRLPARPPVVPVALSTFVAADAGVPPEPSSS
jgi:NADPH-dependent 2,4-dienoyl-CoA reductase/sulfur reductase-like enzyme